MIKTPLNRNFVLYTDIDKNLTQNPVNADILKLSDEESIKESIKNLVMTDRGERLFQPNVGSDVRKMLFENMALDTSLIMKDVIRSCIETYEPRATIIAVDVTASDDQNGISVNIAFSIQNKETPISLTFILDRIR